MSSHVDVLPPLHLAVHVQHLVQVDLDVVLIFFLKKEIKIKNTNSSQWRRKISLQGQKKNSKEYRNL